MYCKNCGSEMNKNQAICLSCGVKQGKGDKFCSNCGSATEQNQSVCLKCGVALKKNMELDGLVSSFDSNTQWLPAGKNKTVAILLALFLGSLGIHNFYLGEAKKGIVRIALSFFFFLGWILALVDMARMITNRYQVNPDAFI